MPLYLDATSTLKNDSEWAKMVGIKQIWFGGFEVFFSLFLHMPTLPVLFKAGFSRKIQGKDQEPAHTE